MALTKETTLSKSERKALHKEREIEIRRIAYDAAQESKFKVHKVISKYQEMGIPITSRDKQTLEDRLELIKQLWVDIMDSVS